MTLTMTDYRKELNNIVPDIKRLCHEILQTAFDQNVSVILQDEPVVNHPVRLVAKTTTTYGLPGDRHYLGTITPLDDAAVEALRPHKTESACNPYMLYIERGSQLRFSGSHMPTNCVITGNSIASFGNNCVVDYAVIGNNSHIDIHDSRLACVNLQNVNIVDSAVIKNTFLDGGELLSYYGYDVTQTREHPLSLFKQTTLHNTMIKVNQQSNDQNRINQFFDISNAMLDGVLLNIDVYRRHLRENMNLPTIARGSLKDVQLQNIISSAIITAKHVNIYSKRCSAASYVNVQPDQEEVLNLDDPTNFVKSSGRQNVPHYPNIMISERYAIKTLYNKEKNDD